MDVAVFPARAMLVAATNPCPCGRQGDNTHRCICRRHQVAAYRSRLSGPILDRIDVQSMVAPVDVLSLHEGKGGESTAVVRGRVARARAAQLERKRRGEVRSFTNARLGPTELTRVCALDAAGARAIKGSIEKLGLSARAYGKVLRVARTFADLGGRDAIAEEDVVKAISLRKLDKDPLAAPGEAA
jgi:magnesium chelatase family protein